MAKSVSSKTSSNKSSTRRARAPAAAAPTAVSEDERRHMIEEAAYFRAQQRGFNGGDPMDDWLAAEREINRLLPSPQQQRQELAAYQKLRAAVEQLLADTKDTLSAETIRAALNDARAQMRDVGEHTADNIEKAIVAIEKEMFGAAQRMGARLDNLSERTSDVFWVWRDRGSQFLGKAATAIGEWIQQVRGRMPEQTYRTGDIAASGTLECTACGGRVELTTVAHVPLCPNCRKSEFRRLA